MSIATITSSPVVQTDPILKLHREESGIDEAKKLTTVASIVSAIALGCLYIPRFALGLGLGAAMLVTQLAISAIPKIIKKEKTDQAESNGSPYLDHIMNNVVAISIFGPIYEEMLFRGIITPAITKAALLAIPALAAPLCGLGMTAAAGVSVALSSVIFGAAHLVNPHKQATKQAISATFGGVVFGLVSHYYGLGSAAAAHIANNAILGLVLLFQSKTNVVPPEQRKLSPDFLNGRKTTLISKA